jgi:hypothetical protein
LQCTNTPGDGEDPLEPIVLELLKPGRLTRELAGRALRRAWRYGVYRALDPLERALLKAAAKAPVREYKPWSTTGRILARIIAWIELYTMKGQVLLAGLRRALTLNPGLTARGPRAATSLATARPRPAEARVEATPAALAIEPATPTAPTPATPAMTSQKMKPAILVVIIERSSQAPPATASLTRSPSPSPGNPLDHASQQ